jgi:chromosome segregation ATPase
MRAATVVFLLAIVFGAQAISLTSRIYTFNALIQKKNNAKSTREHLSALPEKKLSGMGLLNEIQSFLQTSGPVDRLYKLFQDIITEINDEQFRADNVYVLQKAECDEEIAFRTQEVKDAQTALDASTENKKKCEASLARAQAVLELNVQLQDEKNRQLENEAKARNFAHENYVDTVNAINEALRIIQTALDLAHELANDVGALVELRKVSSKMILSGVKAGAMKHYTPVITAFAVLASSEVNAADVARVNELLNRLLDNLNNELRSTDEAENRAVAEYQAYIAALNKALAELRAQESSLRSFINDATACITEESAIIGDATAKRERNQHLLDKAEAMCNSFEKEYSDGNDARKKEKALIERFLTLIKDYFGKEISQSDRNNLKERFAKYK